MLKLHVSVSYHNFFLGSEVTLRQFLWLANMCHLVYSKITIIHYTMTIIILSCVIPIMNLIRPIGLISTMPRRFCVNNVSLTSGAGLEASDDHLIGAV